MDLLILAPRPVQGATPMLGGSMCCTMSWCETEVNWRRILYRRHLWCLNVFVCDREVVVAPRRKDLPVTQMIIPLPSKPVVPLTGTASVLFSVLGRLTILVWHTPNLRSCPNQLLCARALLPWRGKRSSGADSNSANELLMMFDLSTPARGLG